MADYPALVGEAAYGLAALVESLDDAQLDTPSLCDGWRVRGVAGHICSGATVSIPEVVVETVKAGMKIDKAAKAGAIEFADAHAPAEMAAVLRGLGDTFAKGLPRKGLLRMFKATDLVLDSYVHELDIRRPLGLGTEVPNERLVAALSRAPVTKGFVKSNKRAEGLRLVATDVDWTWGTGPEVRGPAEDLLLALTGRPAGYPALEGDGVGVLRQRL